MSGWMTALQFAPLVAEVGGEVHRGYHERELARDKAQAELIGVAVQSVPKLLDLGGDLLKGWHERSTLREHTASAVAVGRENRENARVQMDFYDRYRGSLSDEQRTAIIHGFVACLVPPRRQ